MNLKELEESFKELRIINEKQEKRVWYHETRAQNLTIAYVLLQGLFSIGIVLSSSSPPSSTPRNQWTQYHLDMNYMEQDLIFKKIQEAKHPPAASYKLSHSIKIEKCSGHEQEVPTEHEIVRPDVFQLFKRKVYIYFTALGLFAFTVIQLYACRLFYIR
ncbi:uncharacterized protein LOC133718181 [Rosa rugosa]|uniref:uncharacterized protein LOC133718181 n=1 Tax=Rosa rugosa TaxID=74645 RepID=UPI002B40F76F|nr:uncharacterized protein LOC133718181 [Rosa rugosa]